MKQNNGGFDVSRSIRGHMLLGLLLSAALIVSVVGWAALAQLSGAVVGAGTFVVSSNLKKIQHIRGGTVEEVLVQEGDEVEAGDVLIRLDAQQARSNQAIVTRRIDELEATLARLEAERDNRRVVQFPDLLLARSDQPGVAAVLATERGLFEVRNRSLEGRKAQLVERIKQYEFEIDALKAQEAAYNAGAAVLGGEISALKGLRTQGVVSDQRLNSLMTQMATFRGDRGEKVALQAQVAGRIAETRLQILQIDQDLQTEVGDQIRDLRAMLAEQLERKVSADDELSRLEITAPQSGRVHQLVVHTIGGVISPAEQLMLIVPSGDELAFEVRVAPKDIDQVQLGQQAIIRLTAMNKQSTPELLAIVRRIAAELRTDERTGLSYFLVRLEVSNVDLVKLSEITLLPGMPAEAFIQTGARTAMSYLTKPFLDRLSRAFKEE